MKILESFISIQGEGIRTGRPSLFVRLGGCNLRCVFHDSEDKTVSCCDTNYASFESCEGKYSATDVIKMLNNNPQVQDIVITGGEPLINQKQLVNFVSSIRRECNIDHTLTIETNGTFVPCEELIQMVDLWSVSPKLRSSEPNEEDCKMYNIPTKAAELHRNTRINIEALAKIVEEGHDCQLKFVYSCRECEEEIQSLIDMVQEKVSFNVSDYVMIMPEGITTDAILGKSNECVDVCIRNGWTFSSRMHILIWGNVKEK